MRRSECPTIKASASRAAWTRARIVTDRRDKTWGGYYVCVQLDRGQTPDAVNFVFCPLRVTSGQGRAARGERRRAGCDGNTGNAALADPPYRHCHLEVRAVAGGVGLDPTVYAGARTLSACNGATGRMQVITVGPVTQGDADAVLKSAGPAGWWMPDCTEANGGMLNGETKSVCQRQGRCGGGVRAFTAAFGWLGWLVVAWAACMALDWLSGMPPRQQGRVVERAAARPASGTRPGWWSLCWCAP